MSDDTETFTLSPDTLARIDEVITHYARKRSALLPLLHLIQEERGFISGEAIRWIARKLELQPIQVLEVLTFYPMFRKKPVGRFHIKVCRTLSCALRGSADTCKTFLEEFNTTLNEISSNGAVTVEYVECLASCGSAPAVMINDDLHENVDEAKARELSQQIKTREGGQAQ